MSGNAVSWLECVAKGQQVTLKPIGRDNEDLVSTVLLHLPQKKVSVTDLYTFIIIEVRKMPIKKKKSLNIFFTDKNYRDTRHWSKAC